MKARLPELNGDYLKLSEPSDPKFINRLYNRHRGKPPGDEYIDTNNFNQPNYNEQYNDLIPQESYQTLHRLKSCIIGSLSPICGKNEECKLISTDPNEGACDCVKNFIRNIHDQCIPDNNNLSDDPNDPDNMENLTEKLMMIKQLKEGKYLEGSNPEDDTPEEVQKLSVSVLSKNVQLPEKEVTLAAFTVPDEKTSGVPYKYAWTLISQPAGDVNGSMSDKTKDKLTLSNLSEGSYRFKVEASGKGWYGETYANVTVLPEKRVNKPPDVTIIPKTQIIKLPTNQAILDGSTSKVV